MPKSVKSLTKTTKSGTTTRMKDGKETRQLFETIAKKLLNQQAAKNKLEMEVFCEDLLNKHMSELRRDLINIESALSSRITNVEAKYTVLENRLHETAANLTSKCDTIIADNQKAIDQTNAAIETERIKRLESYKKQSIKSDRVADEIKKLIEDTRADLFIETNNIQQDINLHTIEINRIKDNVEEL